MMGKGRKRAGEIENRSVESIGTNWGDEEGREAAEIGNGSEESIGTNWGDGEGRKGAGKRKWE